jgi:hypothetical protein
LNGCTIGGGKVGEGKEGHPKLGIYLQLFILQVLELSLFLVKGLQLPLILHVINAYNYNIRLVYYEIK